MEPVESLRWHEVVGSNDRLAVPAEVLEACRSVSLRIGGPKIARVGVTSAIREEGRSLVAQALALIQAYDYRRQVILVETDLEHPSLAHHARLPSGPGLAELTQGEASVADVLQPLGPRISAILAGASLPDSTGGILQEMRSSVLARLQAECDVVVLDLPPLLASAYGPQAAELSEHLVLVIRAGITPLPRVKDAMAALSTPPAILLNGVDSSLPRWMRSLLSV